MVSTSGAAHEMAPARPASAPLANHADADQPSAARQSRKSVTRRTASDDEILGLESGAAHSTSPFLDAQLSFDFDAPPVSETDPPANGDTERSRLRNDANGDPESLRAILDSNPELRRDRQDASAYRESFATPEDARAATALVSDLNRMDALFFSHRPEDHAELARSIANLDPAAFTSLAQAMAAYSAIAPNGAASPTAITREDGAIPVPPPTPPQPVAPTPAQTEFFYSTNAAAVETVLDAIESQVERLLPDGVSKNARNRVVGEIYRELDGALRSNRQLGQQMRDAFRSGALDAEHQRAIVSLIAGRARQALPGVAKRVLNEWTSTVVASNQDRRARQHAAERRVDISGSSGGGAEGHRSTSPRDIDYARMSDADILNL